MIVRAYADGEREIKTNSGEAVFVTLDTKPWVRFEKITADYYDAMERLRRERDHSLMKEAQARGVELPAEIEKRAAAHKVNGTDELSAVSRARFELAVEWNIALSGTANYLRRNFYRRLVKAAVKAHRELYTAGEAGRLIPLPCKLEKETFEGIEVDSVCEETLDLYSHNNLIEPVAEAILEAIYPTDEEKKRF